MTFESLFSLGDRVKIDGDAEINGVVIGIWLEDTGGVSAKVSRFHAGTRHDDWYWEGRLSLL